MTVKFTSEEEKLIEEMKEDFIKAGKFSRALSEFGIKTFPDLKKRKLMKEGLKRAKVKLKEMI